MKKVDVITLFPEMLENFFGYGVLNQAQKNAKLSISYHNPRQFTEDKHKTVDDRPYGGGEGMVMMCDPLKKTLESIPKSDASRVIYLSPQGKTYNYKKAQELASYEQIIIICGRYEGVDERFISKYVDEEISVGDFVLSGGELACALVVDAVARFYPGVLGNKASSLKDTFSGDLLKCPQFTRPEIFEGLQVPEILLSGNHAIIEKWRKHVSFLRTHFRRPDLILAKLDKDQYIEELNDALEFLSTLSSKEKYVLGLPLE